MSSLANSAEESTELQYTHKVKNKNISADSSEEENISN